MSSYESFLDLLFLGNRTDGCAIAAGSGEFNIADCRYERPLRYEPIENVHAMAILKQVEAEKELGFRYWMENLQSKAFGMALNWFGIAARHGDQCAVYLMSEVYKELPIGQLKLFANSGTNSGAYFELGKRYQDGYGGVTKDVDQAQVWLQKSAKAGNWIALQFIESLKNRRPPSAAEKAEEHQMRIRHMSFDELLAAAPTGDGEMQYQLGLRYLNRRYQWETHKQNDKDAFRWFLSAAKQGNISAQYKVSDFFRYGRGGAEKSLIKYYGWVYIGVKVELGSAKSLLEGDWVAFEARSQDPEFDVAAARAWGDQCLASNYTQCD